MTQRIDDGGPAFPRAIEIPGAVTDGPGMSLRDWFAGQALIGLSAGWTMLRHTDDAAAEHGGPTIPDEAEDAYRYADAMLAARKQIESEADEALTAAKEALQFIAGEAESLCQTRGNLAAKARAALAMLGEKRQIKVGTATPTEEA